jgi:hypothetical protein
MSNKIEFIYKNSRIEFDEDTEEWIAYLSDDDSWKSEFKRNKSLQKLKDSVDRFNAQKFSPIPILYFSGVNGLGELKRADIISFTATPGQCWIKREDELKEKIIVVRERGVANKKRIFACENIFNEPIVSQIQKVEEDISALEGEIAQKQKERILLIDLLEPFDISGYVLEPEQEPKEE